VTSGGDERRGRTTESVRGHVTHTQLVAYIPPPAPDIVLVEPPTDRGREQRILGPTGTCESVTEDLLDGLTDHHDTLRSTRLAALAPLPRFGIFERVTGEPVLLGSRGERCPDDDASGPVIQHDVAAPECETLPDPQPHE